MDIILASYTDPLEAQIALGRLLAEGIDARLDDAHSVLANWEWRLAIGGVKLHVPRAQLTRAQDVIRRLDAGEFALAPEDDPEAAGAGQATPDRESPSSRLAWIAWALLSIPLPWRRRPR